MLITFCFIVKSVEFLKLNPIGYVPVLVDGDITLADSFAILMVRYFMPFLFQFWINEWYEF